MGDNKIFEMSDIKAGILAFLFKWWVWFIYILIGVIAKLSYDFSKNKKISLWQAVMSTGIALFIGYLSSVICVNNNLIKQGAYIVPICTVLSDKIFIYLIANWKEIVMAIFGMKSPNGEKNDKQSNTDEGTNN